MQLQLRTALCLLIAFGVPLVASAQAPTYYVSPTGDDANPGSLSAPFKTLNKACGLVGPGSTILMRAGTYTDNYCHAQAAGTATEKITLKNYPNEVPILTGTHPYGVLLNMFGSHWVVEGIKIDNTSVQVQVNIVNASYITIRNIVLKNNWGELLKISHSSRITVEGSTFDTSGNPTGFGNGDCLPILGSTQVLVQNNSFTKCGHAAVIALNANEVMSSKIIVRNNLINQHWGGGVYMIRGTTDTLVEGNKVSNTGEQVSYPKACFHPAGERGIWRKNICERTGSGQDGISIAGYYFAGIVQKAINNRIYNNVLYRVGRTPIFMVQKDDGQITGNKFVNNILYRGKVSGTAEPYWPACNCYISADTASSNVPWPNFPNGNYFLGNIIRHADDSGDKANEPRLIYHQTRIVTDYVWSLQTAQTQLAPFFANNRDVNPGFKNAEGGDFSLALGSPAIDTGQNLTITTAAGTSNVVPVDDPYFFFDGFGMTLGDVIRVSANTVTITAVDNLGKKLTVDRAITFRVGDPVNLNFSGAGPDVGAIESTTTPTPQPPLVRKVAWPSGEAKQNVIVETQWRDRFRFKRHLSGAFSEFERVP